MKSILPALAGILLLSACSRHVVANAPPPQLQKALRLAAKRAPASEEAHLNLAKTLRQAGKPAQAARLLNRFASRHPSVAVYAWLGFLHDLSHHYPQGETAYRKALALDPTRDDILNNLGYNLLKQNRKPEAEAQFRAALAANPDSQIARNNLGAMLHWLSTPEPASRLAASAHPVPPVPASRDTDMTASR